MNARKLKIKLTAFFKNLQLLNFEEKKWMALKLFEFVEQFMMDTFSIKNETNLRKLDQWAKFYFR